MSRCQRTFQVQLFDIVDRRILGKFQDFFEKATIVGIIAFQHSKIPSLNQTFLGTCVATEYLPGPFIRLHIYLVRYIVQYGILSREKGAFGVQGVYGVTALAVAGDPTKGIKNDDGAEKQQSVKRLT